MARALGLANLMDYQVGGRRNLIINGAMQVAQRSSSPVTGVNSWDYHAVDRFKIGPSNMGEFTVSQESVTDLPGFTSSLKLQCTTADASPAAGDFLIISQRFEGQDLQHLKKGTSDAESVTLSFWVKSSDTGTYVAELSHVAGVSRHINKSFTIDASATWEYKTITFEGDTTGVIANDSEANIDLNFWLSAGTTFTSGSLQTAWGTLDQSARASSSVNLADDTSNYFEITGIQLEVGETATPFEHRSYGEELALCQRYYQKYSVIDATSVFFSGLAATISQVRASIRAYGGLMRDEPSIYTPTTVTVKGNGSSVAVTSVTASSSEGGGHTFNFNVADGAVDSNHVYYITGREDGGAFELDAEL